MSGSASASASTSANMSASDEANIDMSASAEANIDMSASAETNVDISDEPLTWPARWPVAGPWPSALSPEVLTELREQIHWDPNMSYEQLAGMGDDFLNMLAELPPIPEVLGQYTYVPESQPEPLEILMPKIAFELKKNPQLMEYYLTPDEPSPPSESEDSDAPKKKGKGKSKDKKLPHGVHYRSYQHMFKTREEAKAHRKKVRFAAKKALDTERVKKHGRFYWTKRIYESMINVDLMLDNKTSMLRKRFSQEHYYDEEDLEATAHQIFDSCVKVHEKGWNRYGYHHKESKRGALLDLVSHSLEQRLEKICGLLTHSKALVVDCIAGGDQLAALCDNPISRVSSKMNNNKGNMLRGFRLAVQPTKKQKERKAEKERKEAEKAALKAEKEAAKAAKAAEAAERRMGR